MRTGKNGLRISDETVQRYFGTRQKYREHLQRSRQREIDLRDQVPPGPERSKRDENVSKFTQALEDNQDE